jgi:NADPH-dependent 2,4-dienoyl-CoA reductase/sulfur reductase-like enzyme
MVPDFSSEDDAALLEVGGAQAVSARAARAKAAAERAIFNGSSMEKRVRCPAVLRFGYGRKLYKHTFVSGSTSGKRFALQNENL